TGEVEVEGHRIRGAVVHVAARIAAQAEPGEVLVSQTVNDLVAGSGLEFTERGRRVLGGAPGELRLLSVMDPCSGDDARTNDVFVGRGREVERLEEKLTESASGNGGAVLISGDAGIGKTRVV